MATLGDVRPNGSNGSRAASWLAPPLIGLLAFIAPSVVFPPARTYDAPLFPFVRTAVESVGVATVVSLALAGLLLGLLFDRRPFVLGMLAIALLPVVLIAELTVDSTSHNLFPLELASYAVYGCIVALGAAAGRRLRARRSARLRHA